MTSPPRPRMPLVIAATVLGLVPAVQAATDIAGAPDALFVLRLGVLMLAARLLGKLFARWNLPIVLGEISAGLLAAPWLLGGITLPGFRGGLFADGGQNLLAHPAVAGVTLAVLMIFFFFIGLDTDLRTIRRYSLSGAMTSAGGTLLGFIAAVACASALSASLTGTHLPWMHPAVLLTAAMLNIASIGILAKLLARSRRLDSPAGGVALSDTLADNLFCVLLFTVASGVATATDAGAVPSIGLFASMLAQTIIYAALTAAVIVPLARHLDQTRKSEQETFGAVVIATASALIAGGISGRLGLSPMIGAFVAGAAFSSTDLRHPVRERLSPILGVFVPLLFAVTGTLLDFQALTTPLLLSAAFLLAVAALLAKAAASILPASVAGLNIVGILRVAASTLPRGEAMLALLAAGMLHTALPAGFILALFILFYISCLAAPTLTEKSFALPGKGLRAGRTVPEPVRIVIPFASYEAANVVIHRLLEMLEDEGFFAHQLGRRDNVYRFTKDDRVITVINTEGELAVECLERERGLIATAIAEVAASIEKNLRDVRKPLSTPALRRQLHLADETAATPAPAAIKTYFSPDALRPRLLADTKAGVIAELLDLLQENGLLHDRYSASQAVFEREQNMSTGLEHGVAIPHGRTDAVDRLVCAVGLKAEGIGDYETLDGKPVRIVVLALAPLHAAAPQLQLLSMISQTLNEQGRAALLACDTSDDMYAFFVNRTSPAKTEIRPTSALQWQSISLDLCAKTKEEALDRLIALCARSGAVSSVEDARQAVLARESRMPTGLEKGIAMPHCRTESVDRMVCAVGICREGVDFHAIDGGLSHILIMVLVPPSVTTQYTQLIGQLTRALNEQGRTALMAAKNTTDVLAILAPSAQSPKLPATKTP